MKECQFLLNANSLECLICVEPNNKLGKETGKIIYSECQSTLTLNYWISKTALAHFPHCFPRKFVEVYKISVKEHFILSNEFKTASTDTEIKLFIAQINVKCERDAIFCQVL